MKLSILIPSVFERYDLLKKLTDELNRQINENPESKEIEIIVLLENKRRTTGHKRNDLLELSKGDYVVFIDDDDRISSDYIKELLLVTKYNSDCIIYDVSVSINNEQPKICKYGKEYKHSEDIDYYYRLPNHIMCYKRDIAIQHKFKDVSFYEDDEWAIRATQSIQTQYKINKVLYFYDFFDKPKDWYFSS